MNAKYFLFTACLVVLSVALTRYYWPKVVTKVEVRESETVKRDVVTVVREVIRPDGSTERETVTRDNSTEARNRTESKVTLSRPDWHLGAGAKIKSYGEVPVYSISAERRVFGPAWAGVSADTNGYFGLVVGLEF